MDGITTGMAFLTGLGLPEILLWVLTFAVAFGVLSKLKIFGTRAPAALVSIVVGFLVLLAVPATLITIIASMSTGMLVVAIGFIVLMALIEVAGVKAYKTLKDEKGAEKLAGPFHPFEHHGTIMAIILIGIAALIFWASGGAALIGLGVLPTIGLGTWVLIIVGLSVLWMLSEAK